MGQGLFQLCGFLDKFPHEFKACSDAEYVYLLSAWNEHIRQENKAIKDAGG